MPEGFCQLADNRRQISLIEGAFGEGMPEKRSECGARARMNAIRTRAALGHRSAGTTTGLRGAR